MLQQRIAFISEHASPIDALGGEYAGGQNVYVAEVSRHLGRLGYAVDVFTRRNAPTVPEVVPWVSGVRVINLTAGPLESGLRDELWPLMPMFLQAFLDFMDREHIRYDLIHGNFWMSGWVAMQLRRRLDIPVVQIFHLMGKTKQRELGVADTSPEGRIAVEHDIIREVDRLLAPSPSERTELIEDYNADPAKVVLIPEGVDIDRFQPVPRDEARRWIGLDPNSLVVAYVGRMIPRKDVRNIVRAVALLVRQTDLPVTLLVVGGETAEPDPQATPEIGVLQELAAELGITDRVRFTGQQQQDELRYYYSAADVAVTTPWYEPFGLTPLEAMACGRPVIGSAVGGLTFTIQDGITGYLVPPRDPEALAARLHHLLTQPELCAQMGRAGRARMEREFTWPVVAKRTAALYEELLATSKRLPASQ